MEKQVMDYTKKELENKLIKARVKLNMLRNYANQELHQYRADIFGVFITPKGKLAISIWENIIRRLDE